MAGALSGRHVQTLVVWGLFINGLGTCGALCDLSGSTGLDLCNHVPRPSNVVPFWVWYGFLVRILIRTTNKVLHWRVRVATSRRGGLTGALCETLPL